GPRSRAAPTTPAGGCRATTSATTPSLSARSHPAGARRLAGLPRARARRARRRTAAVAQRRGRRAGRPGRAGGGDRLDGPPRLAGADPRPPDLGDAPAG